MNEPDQPWRRGGASKTRVDRARARSEGSGVVRTGVGGSESVFLRDDIGLSSLAARSDGARYRAGGAQSDGLTTQNEGGEPWKGPYTR